MLAWLEMIETVPYQAGMCPILNHVGEDFQWDRVMGRVTPEKGSWGTAGFFFEWPLPVAVTYTLHNS